MTLLFLDTETGGFPEEVSTLSLCLTAYKFQNAKIILLDELHLFTIPDNGIVVLQPSALRVNKINITNHDTNAVPYRDACNQILTFLKKNYQDDKRFILCGQHVQFDIEHLTNQGLLSERDWKKYVDPRPIDTLILGQVLRLLGIFSEDTKLKLVAMAEALDIKIDKDRLHDAKYDNEVTAKVLFKQLRLLHPTADIFK